MPPNLEVEREMLARMALFAGLNDDQRLALLENYRPYSSLVQIDKNNTIALTMKGDIDFVWRRAMRALDRMRMQAIKEDKADRKIYFSVGEISQEELHVTEDGEEKDELAESSWLMQMFTGSDKEDISKLAGRQYHLKFSEMDERVQIEVIDAAYSQTTDDDNDVYSSALAEQLRDLLVEHLE